MIITDFIVTSADNIQHYQDIAKDNLMHSFNIVSIKDTTETDRKHMTFSYDSDRIAYLMIDIFYAGKKAGIKEMKHKPINKSNHETAY